MNHAFLAVEDYALLRNALADLLQTYGTVEHAASVAEGKAAALRARWSALFIDVMLPDGNGLDVLAHARENGCMAPALVLTARNDAATINRAFDLRAHYIAKPYDWSQVEAFVRLALSTEERIEEVATRWSAAYGLSKPEKEILVAVASGRTRADVASERDIATATFRRHVANILAKTGDASLMDAVARLLRDVDKLGRP